MKELDLLDSLWSVKKEHAPLGDPDIPKEGQPTKTVSKFVIRRSVDLIVPEVTYNGMDGSLNNDHWAFKVPYAFREALDIKYEQRVKNKAPYQVWTQGPLLSFKDGDSLESTDGKQCFQVAYARPMGWDASKEEMYQGNVVFDEFDIIEEKYIKVKRSTCTQMQFLVMLITGSAPG